MKFRQFRNYGLRHHFAQNPWALLSFKFLSKVTHRWNVSCSWNYEFCFGGETRSKKWKVASLLSFQRNLHWTFRIVCLMVTSTYLRPKRTSHKLTKKFLPYNLFELISRHSIAYLYLVCVHAIQSDQTGHLWLNRSIGYIFLISSTFIEGHHGSFVRDLWLCQNSGNDGRVPDLAWK